MVDRIPSPSRVITTEPTVSVNFAGGTNIITAPAIDPLRFTNNFTISYWIRINDLLQPTTWIFRKTSGGSVGYSNIYNYTLGFIEFNATGYTGTNPGFSTATSRIPLADNSWHHIVYTYDGTTWRGYKDKVLIFSTAITFSLSANAGVLALGASSSGVGGMEQNLSDFRLFNTSCSLENVVNLYNRTAGVMSANLQAWYKLTEGSGSTAPDSSVNNNTGTITGATWETESTNYFNRLYRNMFFFGDSVTNGSSASTSEDQYTTILVRNKRLIKVGEAVAGTVIQEQSLKILAHCALGRQIENREQMFMYSGYNNMRFTGLDATSLTYFRDNLYANAIWSAIQDRHKVTGRDDRGNITYTGTWANENTFPGVGKSSTTIGDTVTCRVYGTVVYLASLAIPGGTGQFTWTLDGVSQGTVNCYSASTTSFGVNKRPFVVRVAGLALGYHTITMTVAVNGGSTTFLYATANKGIAPGNDVGTNASPNVYVGNIIYMTAAGYAAGSPANNGSDAAVDAFNAEITGVVNTLVGDGLKITKVENNSNFVAATENFNADLIHPNNIGHGMLATAAIEKVNAFADRSLVSRVVV